METFVIRIWTPADSDELSASSSLRGRLEHVSSGRRSSFRGIDELARLIEESLSATAIEAWQSGELVSHSASTGVAEG